MTKDLRKQFVALLDPVVDASGRALFTASLHGDRDEHRQWLLDTLHKCEDEGADLQGVYAALKAARSHVVLDTLSRVVRKPLRHQRRSVERTKARLAKALRDVIKLHQAYDPDHLIGDAVYPADWLVEPYRQALRRLNEDVVIRAIAAKQSRRGAPARPWLQEIYQALKTSGAKTIHHTALLAPLGIVTASD